ncbi:MAG: TfoX/Sxy family protein [Gammaproteobacteria bacterium]|nr:TfoX/Sxy family protein [Gammaproteobacteria bacterium]MDE0513073.1 TfoX/Sxy family protein [Gammaproteobacteria bacterium]
MDQCPEFISYLVELLAPFGNVRAKRMFGGYGIFKDELMFGLVADETFYLKADGVNRTDFEARGLERFVYYKKGKPMYLSYYQAPEEALDNSEDMLAWAEKSFAAAVRAHRKPVSQ